MVLGFFRICLAKMRTNVQETPKRKKPGPIPGPPTRKYNLLIEEELGEWGKLQPGGLSAVVRRLLKAEQKKQASVRLGK